MNLTDLTVRALPPGTYMDDKLPGFGIRVGLRRRTWIVVRGRGRVKTAIGHYPAVSLQEARRRALVALGSPPDPSLAPPFPDARAEFLSQGEWGARSRYEITRTLNRHFSWTQTLDKITSHDVAKALQAIEAPSERAHALKDIRAFFNWCVPLYIPVSPANGFKAPRYRPRERVLSDDELTRVWITCGEMGLYGTQVRCLILTGQRVSQVVRYSDEWLEGDVITFPASVMKSARQHAIPVGPMTLELLPKLQPVAMQGKNKQKLDQLAGVTNWVIHDLRRVLASQWAALGIALPTIEVYLSHRSGSLAGIVGVYQRHTWMPEMRGAVQKWENRLRSLVG